MSDRQATGAHMVDASRWQMASDSEDISLAQLMGDAEILVVAENNLMGALYPFLISQLRSLDIDVLYLETEAKDNELFRRLGSGDVSVLKQLYATYPTRQLALAVSALTMGIRVVGIDDSSDITLVQTEHGPDGVEPWDEQRFEDALEELSIKGTAEMATRLLDDRAARIAERKQSRSSRPLRSLHVIRSGREFDNCSWQGERTVGDLDAPREPGIAAHLQANGVENVAVLYVTGDVEPLPPGLEVQQSQRDKRLVFTDPADPKLHVLHLPERTIPVELQEEMVTQAPLESRHVPPLLLERFRDLTVNDQRGEAFLYYVTGIYKDMWGLPAAFESSEGGELLDPLQFLLAGTDRAINAIVFDDAEGLEFAESEFLKSAWWDVPGALRVAAALYAIAGNREACAQMAYMAESDELSRPHLWPRSRQAARLALEETVGYGAGVAKPARRKRIALPLRMSYRKAADTVETNAAEWVAADEDGVSFPSLLGNSDVLVVGDTPLNGSLIPLVISQMRALDVDVLYVSLDPNDELLERINAGDLSAAAELYQHTYNRKLISMILVAQSMGIPVVGVDGLTEWHQLVNQHTPEGPDHWDDERFDAEWESEIEQRNWRVAEAILDDRSRRLKETRARTDKRVRGLFVGGDYGMVEKSFGGNSNDGAGDVEVARSVGVLEHLRLNGVKAAGVISTGDLEMSPNDLAVAAERRDKTFLLSDPNDPDFHILHFPERPIPGQLADDLIWQVAEDGRIPQEVLRGINDAAGTESPLSYYLRATFLERVGSHFEEDFRKGGQLGDPRQFLDEAMVRMFMWPENVTENAGRGEQALLDALEASVVGAPRLAAALYAFAGNAEASRQMARVADIRELAQRDLWPLEREQARIATELRAGFGAEFAKQARRDGVLLPVRGVPGQVIRPDEYERDDVVSLPRLQGGADILAVGDHHLSPVIYPLIVSQLAALAPDVIYLELDHVDNEVLSRVNNGDMDALAEAMDELNASRDFELIAAAAQQRIPIVAVDDCAEWFDIMRKLNDLPSWGDANAKERLDRRRLVVARSAESDNRSWIMAARMQQDYELRRRKFEAVNARRRPDGLHVSGAHHVVDPELVVGLQNQSKIPAPQPTVVDYLNANGISAVAAVPLGDLEPIRTTLPGVSLPDSSGEELFLLSSGSVAGISYIHFPEHPVSNTNLLESLWRRFVPGATAVPKHVADMLKVEAADDFALAQYLRATYMWGSLIPGAVEEAVRGAEAGDHRQWLDVARMRLMEAFIRPDDDEAIELATQTREALIRAVELNVPGAARLGSAYFELMGDSASAERMRAIAAREEINRPELWRPDRADYRAGMAAYFGAGVERRVPDVGSRFSSTQDARGVGASAFASLLRHIEVAAGDTPLPDFVTKECELLLADIDATDSDVEPNDEEIGDALQTTFDTIGHWARPISGLFRLELLATWSMRYSQIGAEITNALISREVRSGDAPNALEILKSFVSRYRSAFNESPEERGGLSDAELAARSVLDPRVLGELVDLTEATGQYLGGPLARLVNGVFGRPRVVEKSEGRAKTPVLDEPPLYVTDAQLRARASVALIKCVVKFADPHDRSLTAEQTSDARKLLAQVGAFASVDPDIEVREIGAATRWIGGRSASDALASDPTLMASLSRKASISRTSDTHDLVGLLGEPAGSLARSTKPVQAIARRANVDRRVRALTTEVVRAATFGDDETRLLAEDALVRTYTHDGDAVVTLGSRRTASILMSTRPDLLGRVEHERAARAVELGDEGGRQYRADTKVVLERLRTDRERGLTEGTLDDYGLPYRGEGDERPAPNHVPDVRPVRVRRAEASVRVEPGGCPDTVEVRERPAAEPADPGVRSDVARSGPVASRAPRPSAVPSGDATLAGRRVSPEIRATPGPDALLGRTAPPGRPTLG